MPAEATADGAEKAAALAAATAAFCREVYTQAMEAACTKTTEAVRQCLYENNSSTAVCIEATASLLVVLKK